jgi:hypothetical protein
MMDAIKRKDFSDDTLDTERSNVPEFCNHSTLIIADDSAHNSRLVGIILRKILDSQPYGDLVVLNGEFDDQELRVRRIFDVGGHNQKRTILIRAPTLATTKHIQYDYIIATSEAAAIVYIRKFFPEQYIVPNIAAIKRTLKLYNEVFINTRTRYIGDLWTFYKF